MHEIVFPRNVLDLSSFRFILVADNRKNVPCLGTNASPLVDENFDDFDKRLS